MEALTLPTLYSELTRDERREVRNEYIRLQAGKCFYCDSPLSQEPPRIITEKAIDWRFFPANFLKWPIHLQHNHETDETEGAVHAYCNAIMWQYERR